MTCRCTCLTYTRMSQLCLPSSSVTLPCRQYGWALEIRTLSPFKLQEPRVSVSPRMSPSAPSAFPCPPGFDCSSVSSQRGDPAFLVLSRLPERPPGVFYSPVRVSPALHTPPYRRYAAQAGWLFALRDSRAQVRAQETRGMIDDAWPRAPLHAFDAHARGSCWRSSRAARPLVGARGAAASGVRHVQHHAQMLREFPQGMTRGVPAMQGDETR